MLRIRLRRVGKKKQPAYRIVVADSRAPRDGAFVESIGHYHPLDNPSTIVIKEERARHWLDHGAQPSDRVSKLFAIQGIAELPEKLKTRIALGEQRAKDATKKAKAKAKESAEGEKAAPEAKAEAEAPAPAAEAKPAPEAKAEAEAPAPAAEAKPAPEAKAEAETPAAEAEAKAAPEAKAEAEAPAPAAELEKKPAEEGSANGDEEQAKK